MGRRRARSHPADRCCGTSLRLEPENEVARLLRELESAELYEQQLRQTIVSVRDELAAGHVERALSMLNAALNDIDSATDVVVPHKKA